MKKILIQQGDCILKVCNEIPKTASRVAFKGNSYVVLKGEGVNTHELRSDTLVDDVEIYKNGNTLYLKALKNVSLVHQEHGTTILKSGQIMERIIEREFDYEDMEARETRD